jgi:hypothetical protein
MVAMVLLALSSRLQPGEPVHVIRTGDASPFGNTHSGLPFRRGRTNKHERKLGLYYRW